MGGASQVERPRDERFRSEVPSDRSIESLSGSEFDTLCADATTFFSQPALRPDMCRFSALVASAFRSSTDAELQMTCSSLYAECLNAAPDVTMCDGAQELAMCTATVSELAACLGSWADQIHSLVSDAPDCSAVRFVDFTGKHGEWGETSRFSSTESCQTYQTKCSGRSAADVEFVR